MSRKKAGCWLLALAGMTLLFSPTAAVAQVKSGNPVTVKRFTGLLSNSGYYTNHDGIGTPNGQQPGQLLSTKADWIDFICDPLSLNWKIKIQLNDPHTAYLNKPKICDHVEVMMFYYSPKQTYVECGAVDGKAIYVKRIP